MVLRHAVFDLETLDTIPSARIVSIGAVLFDPRINEIGDTLYMELDWKAQKNRTKSQDTVNWWKTQPAEVRKALKGTMPLKEALEEIQFFLPSDCRVWGNGNIFDISFLEDAYRQADMEIPWKFWNVRDMRTVKDLYESNRGGLGKETRRCLHHALDDAYYEAEMINKMWKYLINIKR